LRPWSRSFHNNRLAAVFALAGLLFYVPAMTLPLMGIRRFGLTNEVGLIDGVTSLMHHGSVLLGFVLLVCSVFLPLGKLVGLLILSTRGLSFAEHRRSLLFHLIELTGRFSILDVLLVAVLIAAVKVGDLVTVYPSPGLIAFAAVVLFSLLSAWAFDRDSIWEAPA
jgi:paraquat-inducible protein A